VTNQGTAILVAGLLVSRPCFIDYLYSVWNKSNLLWILLAGNQDVVVQSIE
jgi:hypothetical protein